MKPAVVFCLVVSLIFISLIFTACSAQSGPQSEQSQSVPEHSQKLTRPAALAMLQKAYYFPVIPGYFRLCVGHPIDFNTGQRMENPQAEDYLAFLKNLTAAGVLKSDPSKSIPDTPGAMAGTVIAGKDCFSPTSPTWGASMQGDWEAKFPAATEKFVAVTGIEEISARQAIVHAVVRREGTPEYRSLGLAYNKMCQQRPGNHVDWEQFMRTAFANDPNLFFPMGDTNRAYDFTKYDDGWRPGH